MIRSRLPPLLLGLLLLLSGCVRREGRNSDCRWTSGPAGVDQRDLRADLEFAEELAIRYMDAHSGPRDQAMAAHAKNHCMGILLAAIGNEHGVSAQEAFRSFGQRAALADVMMNLPFLLIYVLAGDFMTRRVLLRYPPSDGWMPTVMMIVLASVAFGAGGLLLGQQWSALAESIRVGTTHLSNRVFRLPINQHPITVFAFLAALFLSIAVMRCWTRRNARLAT
jgi:hypothetical protein